MLSVIQEARQNDIHLVINACLEEVTPKYGFLEYYIIAYVS